MGVFIISLLLWRWLCLCFTCAHQLFHCLDFPVLLFYFLRLSLLIYLLRFDYFFFKIHGLDHFIHCIWCNKHSLHFFSSKFEGFLFWNIWSFNLLNNVHYFNRIASSKLFIFCIWLLFPCKVTLILILLFRSLLHVHSWS